MNFDQNYTEWIGATFTDGVVIGREDNFVER